jgi:hypothetical protein
MVDSNLTQYEPKRNNLFLVEFPKQFNLKSWTIQKINKPNYTNNKWENIKIEFIDTIAAPSASQSLFKIVEFLKTNENDSKILFEIKINSLDPTGVAIDEWVVYVKNVPTINFGELDYSNDELQTPFLIVEPLNCVLKY